MPDPTNSTIAGPLPFARFVCWVCLVVPSLVALLVGYQGELLRLAAHLVFFATGGAGLGLMRAGKHGAAFRVLAFGCWLGTVTALSYTGGIRGNAVVALPVIIMLSAWLVGIRTMVLLGLMTIAVLFGYALLDLNSLLPVRYEPPIVQRAVILSVIIVTATALGYFAARTLVAQMTALALAHSNLESKVAALAKRESELRHIIEGTARATGAAFFRALVRNLAHATGMRCAMVAELLPDRRHARATAFWTGQEYREGVAYILADSPCQHVAEKGEACFPDRVDELFPNDQPLAAMGIRSYYGVRLDAGDGTPLGVLVVLDGAAIHNPSEIGSLVSVFAARAAAEFERIRADDAQRAAADDVRRLNVELEARVAARTAELASLNQELEAFSYSMSHDLRAPLRSIDGFGRMLEEDYASSLDDNGRSYILRMRRAAQRLAQLIDDLLDLSRINRAEFRTTDVDLSALAAEIVDELRQGAPQRTVTVSIEKGLRVRGDPQLLRVALQNLLDNAWKYSGKVKDARMNFGCDRSSGVCVYFVDDNGAGFDMARADKLFTPFQRLHSPQDFEGTGVGLASVARAIKRHGGRIWAESAPGQGATFYFTLG